MLHKSFFLLYVVSMHLAVAQDHHADTAFYRGSLDSTIALYTKSFGENTLLYNGREYNYVYSRTIGHPFYASDQPQKGFLFYDGTLYQHESITYDLVNDEIFIKAFQNTSLKLLNEKLDRFSLKDHLFVKISPVSSNPNGLSAGFYEMLFDGSITVLAKRRKQLEPTFNLADPYKFVQYDRYFIHKDDAYFEVTSESSLLSIFPAQKKEIRKYMRENGIRFKKDRENAIVQVATYYAQFKR